jgi:Cytochrome b subunit of formate dehydrogenase
MEKSEEKERGFWASIFPTIGDIIATLVNDFLFDDPKRPGVMRFSFPARVFHWAVALLVILMGLTGLILFVPGWGVAGLACWTRIIHRVAAYIFAVVLVVYFVSFREKSLDFLKEAFVWTRDDLGWLRAAIDYYTGGEESKMPPQGHINAGQKIWQLIAIVCGVIFYHRSNYVLC